MKRTPIWRWAAVACHLSALLAPGAWLYFVRHAGTSFRWAGFTGRNLLVCLVLSLLPTALFFLAQLLQRRHQQSAWGSVLACLLFLLAAAGWLYTLCDSWSLWNAAQAAPSPDHGAAPDSASRCLTGAICALCRPCLKSPPSCATGRPPFPAARPHGT
ncbi:MAG: hypothetical protein ACLSHU_13985 [Oscillospiraceae bacterium]